MPSSSSLHNHLITFSEGIQAYSPAFSKGIIPAKTTFSEGIFLILIRHTKTSVTYIVICYNKHMDSTSSQNTTPTSSPSINKQAVIQGQYTQPTRPTRPTQQITNTRPTQYKQQTQQDQLQHIHRNLVIFLSLGIAATIISIGIIAILGSILTDSSTVPSVKGGALFVYGLIYVYTITPITIILTIVSCIQQKKFKQLSSTHSSDTAEVLAIIFNSLPIILLIVAIALYASQL